MPRKYKICIDAGHGGKDPGAVKGSRYEKDDTLRIGKRLKKVLEANGFEVFMTRSSDRYDSPSQKAVIGNRTGADYFISIHRNSGAFGAKGTEILVYSKSGKKYDIARNICRRFAKRGFKDRGVKVRKNLAVLRGTTMPAILIELGFISSKSDNQLLDEKFYSLVNDIGRGLMEELGLKFRTLTQIKEGE